MMLLYSLFHDFFSGTAQLDLWSLKNEATRGYGGFGALGHSVYHRELTPRLVEGSWRGRVTHIATSGAHTAAITESGCLSPSLY